MDSQPLSPPTRLHGREMIAVVTTACLAGTVLSSYLWILPWYSAVMEQGGYLMPLPFRVANALLTSVYLRWALLAWGIIAGWRRRRATRRSPVLLQRVLATVNVVSVVALMALGSGLIGFAMHGLKAPHNVVTAQEQAGPKSVVQPASTRQH